MAVKATRWLKLFEQFLPLIRVRSREVVATDPRGSPLEMWESQRRFVQEVGQGLDNDIHVFRVLKSRQLGITTVSLAIDVFWLALHPGLIGCLVTDTEKNREADRNILIHYINSMPEGYFGDQFKIIGNNRSMLRFSNGARLDFLVAGTKNKGISWGEGIGYAFAHATEVANYGSVEGLKSLEEGFSTNNPDALYIYESTAKGFNHWRSSWLSGQADKFSQRSFFIGWWAGDHNIIKKSDPKFMQFGRAPASGEEREKTKQVEEQYGHKVNQEQLAWIRWKQSNAGAEKDLLEQNQPWTAEEAFVLTGYSFFQPRVVTQDLQKIYDGVVLNISKGYRYEVDGGFYQFRMHALDPRVDPIEDVELKVWEEPEPGGKYVIGMDPAYGRKQWKDHHCLDDQTEILTKNGWLNYRDVEIGDEAVCFNLQTESYEYGVVSDKIVRQHIGVMHSFTSKGLDCLVTPEHRVVNRFWTVSHAGEKRPWRFLTADKVASFKKSVIEIPVGGSPIGDGVPDLSLDMCRVLGWILTDGHVQIGTYSGSGERKGWRRIRPCISIAQSIGTVKAGVNISEEMREVTSRMGAVVREWRSTQAIERGSPPQISCSFGVEESEQFLRWFDAGHSRIPRIILTDGSQAQLEALFQGVLEGDGNWSNREQQWVSVCPGKDWWFASDIQELAAKLGYSASIAEQVDKKTGGTQWRVRLSVRAAHTFVATNAKVVDYQGDVWCVTVPTGAFVARRGGKMFVTGNCISVFRCFADKMIQVAEYSTADVEVKHAAWVLFHLAAAYRDCLINVEITGPGTHVMTEFDHLRQLLAAEMNKQATEEREWQDAASSARWYLYHRPDSIGAGYQFNFESHWRTKQDMLHGLRGSYMSGEIEIRSVRLLKEMSIVVVNDDDIGAPESKDENAKDDCVFALGLANKAWREWVRKDMIAQGLTWEVVMNDAAPDKTPQSKSLNHLVRGFLLSQAQAAEEARLAGPQPPLWKSEHGLA